MSLWNPLTAANRLNPYPMYETLRTEGSVYQSQTNEWVITGYDEVKSILTNKSFGSGNRKMWLERSSEYLLTKKVDIQAITQAIDTFVLQLDPPKHTKIRKFILNNWSREGVEQIVSNNIAEVLSELKSEQIDIVEDYSAKLPVRNISRILGITQPDYLKLHELCSEMIKALDLYVDIKDLVQLNEASKEFINFFLYKIDTEDFGDGLALAYLKANKLLEEPLSKEELTSIFIFLFVAAEETTVSFISLSLYHILKNQLVDEFKRGEITQHLEELLRYDSPVQLLGRIALEDIEIAGQRIKSGETVTLAIGAANRDPKQFPNPNQILLDRNPRHLTFGQGIHYCLGDWLAKLTATKAIPAFLNHYSEIELIGEPENWYDNIAIRGFHSLKVNAKS